jgi:hypothetical protein
MMCCYELSWDCKDFSWLLKPLGKRTLGLSNPWPDSVNRHLLSMQVRGTVNSVDTQDLDVGTSNYSLTQVTSGSLLHVYYICRGGLFAR